jgi:HEAT repeats
MIRKRLNCRAMKLLLAGLAVLLALGVAGLVVRRPAVPQPTYEGKTVSNWAFALNYAGTQRQAEKAILTLGSNAVPSLVQLLRAPDPILAKPIQALGRCFPSRFSRGLYRLTDPFAAAAGRAAAARSLRVLGPRARAALPALTDALFDDPIVSWNAALTLAQFGEAGLTALTRALPRSPPANAGGICYALGTQGPSASNAVPTLAAIMETAPPPVAESAGKALGAIGRVAVPRLRETLEHGNTPARVLAVNALAIAGPPARTALPKLMRMAAEDEPPVRAAVVAALPRIRPTGTGLSGVLSNALRDPDRQVRSKAAQAPQNLPQPNDQRSNW